MQFSSESVETLVEQFSRLPGIGRKTARRLAAFVLKQPKSDVVEMAEALIAVKEKVIFCSTCFNVADHDLPGLPVRPSRWWGDLCLGGG